MDPEADLVSAEALHHPLPDRVRQAACEVLPQQVCHALISHQGMLFLQLQRISLVVQLLCSYDVTNAVKAGHLALACVAESCSRTNVDVAFHCYPR